MSPGSCFPRDGQPSRRPSPPTRPSRGRQQVKQYARYVSEAGGALALHAQNARRSGAQAKWLAAKCQMVCGRPQAAARQRRQSACSASLVKAQVACQAPPPARPPCRRRLLPAPWIALERSSKKNGCGRMRAGVACSSASARQGAGVWRGRERERGGRLEGTLFLQRAMLAQPQRVRQIPERFERMPTTPAHARW